MGNILMFWKGLKNISGNLKFHFNKIKMLSNIAFKSEKKLKLISVNYFKHWQFDNAYLVVNIECKNAIWIETRWEKYLFTSGKPIILDLEKVEIEKKEEIILHGFFQKQKVIIDVKKILKLASELFKVELLNLNNIKFFSPELKLNFTTPQLTLGFPKVTLGSLKVNLGSPKVNLENISIRNKEIKIKHKPFKLQDYI